MLMIIYNNYGTFAFNMSVVLDNCALMIQDTRFKGLSLYYKSSLHDEVHTERRGGCMITNLIRPTVVSREKQLQILWEGLVEEVFSLNERLADGSVLEFHEQEVAAHLVPVALQRHRTVLG